MSEIPELSQRFTDKWYDSGENEESAMLDQIVMNAATGETTPGIFINTIWYSDWGSAYLVAKKAMETAVGLDNTVAPFIVRSVPHFSAVPSYLLEHDSKTRMTVIWINAHVILEGGEDEFRRVVAEAKAEAAAWDKAEKGDFGPLQGMKYRQRNKGRMPTYRTSALKKGEVQKSVHDLLRRKGIRK